MLPAESHIDGGFAMSKNRKPLFSMQKRVKQLSLDQKRELLTYLRFLSETVYTSRPLEVFLEEDSTATE